MPKPKPQPIEERLAGVEQLIGKAKWIAAAVVLLAGFLGYKSWSDIKTGIASAVAAALPAGMVDSVNRVRDSSRTLVQSITADAKDVGTAMAQIRMTRDSALQLVEQARVERGAVMRIDSVFVSAQHASEWSDTIPSRIRVRSAWADLGPSGALYECEPSFREGDARVVIHFRARQTVTSSGRFRYTVWIMGW